MNRQSIDILSRLLAEENIKIVHSPSATTASFNPNKRELTFPTYGSQISSMTQIGLALHETGHATDTPAKVLDLMNKYGQALVNILEDVRIEKIVKRKFPGSKKYFAGSYAELIEDHNFFGTANKSNPYNFDHMRFLDRVNCHFKVGPKAMVEFSDSEQKIVDRIDQLETLDDVEVIAKELYDIAQENKKRKEEEKKAAEEAAEQERQDQEAADAEPESGEDGDGETESSEDDSENSESGDDSESGDAEHDEMLDEEFGDGEDDSELEIDDSEDSDSDEDFGTGSDTEESDDDSDSDGPESNESGESAEDMMPEPDDSDDCSPDGPEEDESESKDELVTGESIDGDVDDSETPDDSEETDEIDEEHSDEAEGDTSNSGESNSGESGDDSQNQSDADTDPEPEPSIDLDEEDLEESEIEKASSEVLEKLAENSGLVGTIPKTSEIENITQPWTDIEPFVSGIVSEYPERYSTDLINFRKEMKPTINKMVAEFNRKSSGATHRRTSYKDTGTLDPVKMVQYKFNDNIFKSRKMVRDGKNHGVVLFVDFTGSMHNRIYSIMRQTMIMVEFCRKINLPFRVYGWSNVYLPGTDFDYNTSRGSGFHNVAITEIMSSDMPKAKLEMFSKWALTGRGMTDGGSTPLMSALYYSMPILAKFRKEAGVHKMKMMFFTDGEGGTDLPSWNATTLIDEETGTQYGSDSNNQDFFADKDSDQYGWRSEYDREKQQYLLAKILYDRFKVETVFMFMNEFKVDGRRSRRYGNWLRRATISFKLESGQWSPKEIKTAYKTIQDGARIAKVGERGPYTYIVIEDGYDVSTKSLSMKIGSEATPAQVKKEFKRAMFVKRASTMFATITAESLAK